MEGKSTAVESYDWTEVAKVIKAARR